MKHVPLALLLTGLSAASVAAFAPGCSSDSTPAATTDTGTAATDTGSTVTDTGTATDSTTPTDSAKDTPADVPAPTKVDCDTYCDRVMTNCTGVNAQYPTKGQCINICAKLTVGGLDDKTGDTVGCRQHFAVDAASDPVGNCRKAGMTGGLTCGADRCTIFCTLALAQCKGVAGATFTSETDCKTACGSMTFNSTAGEIEQVKGSLNCVQYHLEAAYETTDGVSATTHCKHLTLATPPCAP